MLSTHVPKPSLGRCTAICKRKNQERKKSKHLAILQDATSITGCTKKDKRRNPDDAKLLWSSLTSHLFCPVERDWEEAHERRKEMKSPHVRRANDDKLKQTKKGNPPRLEGQPPMALEFLTALETPGQDPQAPSKSHPRPCSPSSARSTYQRTHVNVPVRSLMALAVQNRPQRLREALM